MLPVVTHSVTMGCQRRAEGLAGAVNEAKVTIVTGEWEEGWSGGSGEECDHKPVIYSWLVSRAGEEDTGVKTMESIVSPSMPAVEQKQQQQQQKTHKHTLHTFHFITQIVLNVSSSH